MKFQCGECGKYYRIDSSKISRKGVTFKCEKCSNKFTISGLLVFSSTNGHSRLGCDNCGQFLHEDMKKCDQCNLKLNKLHEELRIDNKYYENLNLTDSGKVFTDDAPKKRGKIIGVCSVGLVVIISAALGLYYFKDALHSEDPQITSTVTNFLNKKPEEIETKVVILKTGKTLYVTKIEKDNFYYRLTGMNGMEVEVKEDEILQISKAVVRK